MASPEILCSLSLVVDAIALSKRAYNLNSPQIFLIYGDVGGVNPIIERTLISLWRHAITWLSYRASYWGTP